jgi:hypothetical protein
MGAAAAVGPLAPDYAASRGCAARDVRTGRVRGDAVVRSGGRVDLE